MSLDEATSNSERIKLVALVIIKLCLSEGISQSVCQSVKNSTKNNLKKINFVVTFWKHFKLY